MSTESEEPDLASYDHVIVAFSGGKDSLACLLHLLDLGVPRERIGLWHHDVDGREGSSLTCAACIFGSPDQWASLRAANPAQFGAVAAHEARSGKTIQRKLSVVQLADKGTPYPMDAEDIRAALSTSFEEPVILPPGAWKLPRGAFGDSCGPT